VSYEASAYDVVDGAVGITCTPASGSTFRLGTTTVACSASDSHSNSYTNTFVVTVQDTTPPVLALPAGPKAEATGPAGAAVSFSATASDLVDGTVAVSCDHQSGDPFPLGVTEVKCSASDKATNTASGSFKVEVVDTTPPIVTPPANLVLEATGPAGATATFGAVATDLVDGPVTPTCLPASGGTFPLGATTVTCAATDARGNKGNAQFTVTVVDTTPPALSLPTLLSQEATGPHTAVTWTATATDLVSGPVEVDCDPGSGAAFGVGTTTITCWARDGAGNLASGSFSVEVHDTTPPEVTVPADLTAEATAVDGAAATFAASAADLVDGEVTTSCAPLSGSRFPIGTTTVSCSATDTHGNTGTSSFEVTVQDTTPPALTLPADVTLEADGADGTTYSFSWSANDLVDGDLSKQVSCDWTSPAKFPLDLAIPVTCSVTDGHGNQASGTFYVTVKDTTAPKLTAPASIEAQATSAQGATVTFTVAATDRVDGEVAVSCTPASGSVFAIGPSESQTTVVDCMATDRHGNAATEHFPVTVVDKLGPALTLPPDLTVEATGKGGAAVVYAATALDVVDGPVTPVCTPASGSTFPLDQTTVVTCTVTDNHRNTVTGSFKVTVQDTSPPALTLPGPITREATGPGGAPVSYEASALDVVDGPVAVGCSKASGSTFSLGTTTVSCSARDAHGRSFTSTFAVTVVDTTSPVIAKAPDLRVTATGTNGAVVSYAAPTATDVVDGTDGVSCAPASGALLPLGDTTISCSTSDKAGNRAESTFKVSVSYAWSGFLDPLGRNNPFKLGSTIPVKFQLTGSSAGVTSAFATLSLAKMTNGVAGDPIVAAATGGTDAGNVFRYDGLQYIFNLGTKGLSDGTWQFTIDLHDGYPQSALVGIRK